ncbi:hypothetical protein [Pseudodesulfovibrio sp.]|uniref:hypothetical protein n=1 Tax=unclassified Pseudodesulfovibrio TaxID=2661612 RepID=UPI003B00C85A
MSRLVPCVFGLLLLFGLMASPASAAGQQPFMVHFVVVPAVLPDGGDASSAVLEFKKEVLKLAGGFTELGPCQGGSLKDSKVNEKENVAFIIGADKDISKELKALSLKLFHGGSAFILAWPGKVIF